ncbi:McrB family protein [Amycolatopsis sp. NBC_00438]|uniref:McrB family protein n=1 Tax=Amycolatopsis sp. NBC_00438 TaxID=2903558 RepID=UPI003FA45EA0
MTRTRIPYPSVQPVYAVVQRWRDRCLLDESSLFDDDHISTADNADILVRDFVEQPDLGKDSFLTKLRGQLSASPPAAVRLAAELLYVHLLIARSTTIGGTKKTALVQDVLSLAGGGDDVPAEFATLLQSGLVSPGRGYNSNRWRQYGYLIRVVAALKQLLERDRTRAVTEPRAFVTMLDGIDEDGGAIQRFSLEHLLFPNVFAPVVSREHRQHILNRWSDLAGPDTELPSFRLASVANNLTPNGGWGPAEVTNFYRSPYRWEWLGEESRWKTLVQWGEHLRGSVDLEQEERGYKLDAAAALKAARQAGPPTDLQKLRALNLIDWRATDSFMGWLAQAQDGETALARLWDDAGPASVDRFLDLVPETALAGSGARLSLASVLLAAVDIVRFPPWRARAVDAAYRLTGYTKPEPSATDGERYETFLVFLDQVIDAFGRYGSPLTDRLEAQSLVWALMTYEPPDQWSESDVVAFRGWRQGSGALPGTTFTAAEPKHDSPVSGAASGSAERPLSELAAKLYLDESFLDEMVQLLLEKKQVVFQGSPGTGKTHVARELAAWLTGAPDRVRLVQFHPTYSYEDFVEGFRPQHDGNGFRLVTGPLLRIAEQARKDPDHQYALIIDELNRANVARVFGELYFLLEYRKEKVQLLYRDEPVDLPPNLMVIATMNTADRSIALLDSALRRRFYFVDFDPQSGPVSSVLRRYLQEEQPGYEWVADLVATANERIADPDAAIGPSHFFRDGLPIDDAWLELVWEHAVLPTLRDHFHGRLDKLADLSLAALRAEVTGADEDAEPA